MLDSSFIRCRISAEQIDEMIASGEKFVPIFLRLYTWYKANMRK